MGNSFNTEKESVWAGGRIGRDGDGDIVLPRIVERKAARGDVHALPKKVLRNVLRKLPVEYIYGLSRTELRAREGKEIGEPFGVYLVSEKSIILYSLPMEWRLSSLPTFQRNSLEKFFAEISGEEGNWRVVWPMEAFLGMWFFRNVLTHELGHHFAEQYKKKRGRISGVRYNELNAELHAFRLTQEMFDKMRKKREDRKGE